MSLPHQPSQTSLQHIKLRVANSTSLKRQAFPLVGEHLPESQTQPIKACVCPLRTAAKSTPSPSAEKQWGGRTRRGSRHSQVSKLQMRLIWGAARRIFLCVHQVPGTTGSISECFVGQGPQGDQQLPGARVDNLSPCM